MNQESVSFGTRKEFSKLLQRPARRGMLRNIKVEESSRADVHHEEDIDQPKCGRYLHEKIAGKDGFGMVVNEGSANAVLDRKGGTVWECIAEPSAGRSECRFSTAVRRQSVPHPMTDCSLPFRRSVPEDRLVCGDGHGDETSISKTTGSLHDATESAYRV